MAMARPPLAPARLRAPDGYVATRESRSKNLNAAGAQRGLASAFGSGPCNCAHECNCDGMIATRTPSATLATLSRSASIHASPHAAQSMPSDRAAREPMPNAAQPSTQAAPLHQHPHPDPCSSDRCLICLTRPDDFEDLARGMTCGMCSACGTFFCGCASASVATPSPRLISS